MYLLLKARGTIWTGRIISGNFIKIMCLLLFICSKQDMEKPSHIPANFYGLQNSTRQVLIKLPLIKDKDLSYGLDTLYLAALYCL